MQTFTLSARMAVEHEEHFIRQAKERPAAFKPLYEMHYPGIMQYVYNKTDDQHIAGDITSTVFLKALQAIKQYEFRKVPFRAWLFKIAYNEVMQYYRYTRQQQKVYIAATFIQEFSRHTGEQTEKEIERLKQALTKLKPKEINLLELRYWDSYSIKEIAYVLSLSETNVKVRLHRTHQKLRQLLSA